MKKAERGTENEIRAAFSVLRSSFFIFVLPKMVHASLKPPPRAPPARVCPRAEGVSGVAQSLPRPPSPGPSRPARDPPVREPPDALVPRAGNPARRPPGGPGPGAGRIGPVQPPVAGPGDVTSGAFD